MSWLYYPYYFYGYGWYNPVLGLPYAILGTWHSMLTNIAGAMLSLPMTLMYIPFMMLYWRLFNQFLRGLIRVRV